MQWLPRWDPGNPNRDFNSTCTVERLRLISFWRLTFISFDHSICVFGPKATVKHSTGPGTSLQLKARGQDLTLDRCQSVCVRMSVCVTLQDLPFVCELCDFFLPSRCNVLCLYMCPRYICMNGLQINKTINVLHSLALRKKCMAYKNLVFLQHLAAPFSGF